MHKIFNRSMGNNNTSRHLNALSLVNVKKRAKLPVCWIKNRVI